MEPKGKLTKNASHLNRRVKTGLNIILRTVEAIYYHLEKGKTATKQVPSTLYIIRRTRNLGPRDLEILLKHQIYNYNIRFKKSKITAA